MLIRNRRAEARDIAATGQTVDAHGLAEVPDHLAGRAPSGDDPGEGLLAQVDNWGPGVDAVDDEGLEALGRAGLVDQALLAGVEPKGSKAALVAAIRAARAAAVVPPGSPDSNDTEGDAQ